MSVEKKSAILCLMAFIAAFIISLALFSDIFWFMSNAHSDKDYWNDIDARVEEYIWEKNGGEKIPVVYYEYSIRMMQEIQRQMNEHEDGKIVSYKWDYADSQYFNLQTIILSVRTEKDDHHLTALIAGN